MTNGIHVELAVSACEGCPVAALSSSTAVEEFRIDADDARVEFVAPDPPEDPPGGLDLVEFAGEAHGRYEITCERPATDGGLAIDAPEAETGADAGPSSSPAAEPSPTQPPTASATTVRAAGFRQRSRTSRSRRAGPRWRTGNCSSRSSWTGHEELQAIVDECEAAGLGVELRRLCVDRGDRSATDDSCRDVVPVDLAGVTDRQAEVAAVAAEKGYFNGDGASAGEIAADLDLAKSTVSEHLRTMTDTLFSQAFGDGT